MPRQRHTPPLPYFRLLVPPLLPVSRQRRVPIGGSAVRAGSGAAAAGSPWRRRQRPRPVRAGPVRGPVPDAHLPRRGPRRAGPRPAAARPARQVPPGAGGAGAGEPRGRRGPPPGLRAPAPCCCPDPALPPRLPLPAAPGVTSTPPPSASSCCCSWPATAAPPSPTPVSARAGPPASPRGCVSPRGGGLGAAGGSWVLGPAPACVVFGSLRVRGGRGSPRGGYSVPGEGGAR